ncbi:HPr kinase/phosphorylase [Methylopila turkensis]|uniref:HPr kinase n=1 Tax=Methylopila turkensis TaxID=1437816 RepID=A0A9W6JLZ8_9HYPH|nr:HPr kinase/phosphatase C-terminal domain-containing protein [Methylopila turkensis]GLK78663.1 HPr kinase [Methylopila turkensis]
MTEHATCVVVGDAGVLIRGPSGAGKSSLALELLDRAERDGRFGRLVADDRVTLSVHGGRLVAAPPAALAGLIEIRGVGIVRRAWLPGAVVRLVVDLVEAPERLPPDEALSASISGVSLPRLPVAARSAAGGALVSQALTPMFTRPHCDVYALAFAPQHEKLGFPAPQASAS